MRNLVLFRLPLLFQRGSSLKIITATAFRWVYTSDYLNNWTVKFSSLKPYSRCCALFAYGISIILTALLGSVQCWKQLRTMFAKYGNTNISSEIHWKLITRGFFKGKIKAPINFEPLSPHYHCIPIFYEEYVHL